MLLFSAGLLAQVDGTIDKGTGWLYFSGTPGTTPNPAYGSEVAINVNTRQAYIWNRLSSAWIPWFTLGSLSGVDTSSVAVGKILKWNGSAWVASDDVSSAGSGVTVSQIASVTDTTSIVGPAEGDIAINNAKDTLLIRDGSAWVVFTGGSSIISNFILSDTTVTNADALSGVTTPRVLQYVNTTIVANLTAAAGATRYVQTPSGLSLSDADLGKTLTVIAKDSSSTYDIIVSAGDANGLRIRSGRAQTYRLQDGQTAVFKFSKAVGASEYGYEWVLVSETRQQLPTRSDLVLAPGRVGEVLQTSGYTTANDGGAARYLIHSTTLTGYNSNAADTIAVIALPDGNYAHIQDATLEAFGIVRGSGVSTATAKENWRRFKKALEYFRVKNGGIVSLEPAISGTWEFWVSDGQGYAPGGDTRISLNLKGSTFRFLPHAPFYAEEVFDLSTQNINLDIRNGTLITEPTSIETYSATLRVGGDATKVFVNPASVRAAFGTEVVGRQIYISPGYDLEADTVTVLSYSSGTITLTRSMTVGSADLAGFIGMRWADGTALATIQQYGKRWSFREGASGPNLGFDFVNATYADTSKTVDIYMEGISSSGFYDFVYRSGCKGRHFFQRCSLSASVVVIANFQNFAVYSTVQVENSYVYNTGFESQGQNPGNIDTDGDRYQAGTIYTHPNTQLILKSVRFDSCMVPVRQFSSSGSKPLPAQTFSSLIENCTFRGARDQYHILTSQQLKTEIRNCDFEGNQVWCRGFVVLENCKFTSVPINMTTASGTTQYPSSNKAQLTVHVINSYLDSLTYFNIDETQNTKLVIQGSKIITPVTSTYGSAYFTSSVPDSLWIIDSEIQNNKPTGNSSSSFLGFFTAIAPNYTKIVNTIFNIGSDYIFYRLDAGKYVELNNVTILSGNLFRLGHVSSGWKNIKISNTELPVSSPPGFGSKLTVINWPFGERNYPTTVSPTTDTYNANTQYILPSAATFRLNNKYNYFKLSGTAKRIVFSQGSSTDWSFHTNRRGFIRVKAVGGAVSIPAFNSSTVDSTSNFLNALSLSDGEEALLYFDNSIILAGHKTAVTGDGIGTGTASATRYDIWEWLNPLSSTFNGYRVIPGTVTITAGATTFVDDGDGNLTSAGGYGYIDYVKNYITLIFTAAPGVVAFTADYQYATSSSSFNVGAFMVVSKTSDQSTISSVVAKQVVQSGSGAPGTTPNFTGEIYIDTGTGNIYMAAGTASSADWKQISN